MFGVPNDKYLAVDTSNGNALIQVFISRLTKYDPSKRFTSLHNIFILNIVMKQHLMIKKKNQKNQKKNKKKKNKHIYIKSVRFNRLNVGKLLGTQWFLMEIDGNYRRIDGNCKEIDLIQDSHPP